MVDKTLEHQSFGLSGRALCIVLFSKYVGLAIYGIWAGVVEIPTFVVVGSSPFAIAWASFVFTFAFLAALGVYRTWTRGRYRLEKWTTAGFILTFSGYSFALIFRSATLNDWDNAPLALIPIFLCITPTVRYFQLVVHGHFRFGYPRRRDLR